MATSQGQGEPNIKLWPVCVNKGDAIFISVESGEKKDAYLVDGGTKCEQNKVQAAYDKIVGGKNEKLGGKDEKITGSKKNDDESMEKGLSSKSAGPILQRIIATHSDERHTGGIPHILELESKKGGCPDILFSTEFDEKKINQGAHDSLLIYPLESSKWKTPLIHDQQDFYIAHESFTSKLKLQSQNKPKPVKQDEQKSPEKFRKNSDAKKKNESSIVTTIYHGEKILACLTSDAFFDESHSTDEILHDKDITVFQVPLHGSENNSNSKLYMKIAKKTTYYLISCGKHEAKGQQYPHEDVLTAIREATIHNKKEGTYIVLTNGYYLTGTKMKSFTGDKYEPTILYWDEQLYKLDALKNQFLQFNLHPQPAEMQVLDHSNLVMLNIDGYKTMVKNLCMCSKYTTNIIYVEAQLTNKEYLTTDLANDGHKLSTKKDKGRIKVIPVPPPTNPCNWKDEFVLLILDLKKLVFLQLDGKDKFSILQCADTLWQIQYCKSCEDGKFRWQEEIYNQLLNPLWPAPTPIFPFPIFPPSPTFPRPPNPPHPTHPPPLMGEIKSVIMEKEIATN